MFSWGATPMTALISMELPSTSLPRASSLPDVMGLAQRIMRMVVLFPAPFGPRKPKHSPSSIWKSTASTALSSSKTLVSFSPRTAGMSGLLSISIY